MEGKSAFQRIFLIFGNEDSGYEAGQKPSGHVRIEVRDGRGKLWAAIQNLMLENGRFDYKLYLIKAQAGMTVPVCAGKLKSRQSKAELEWEFDPLNVFMSGHGIEEFGIAAVLVEYKDRKNTSVICPIAAYRDKKTEWRNKVGDILYNSNDIQKPYENYVNKNAGFDESKYNSPENDLVFDIPDAYKTNQVGGGDESFAKPQESFEAKPYEQPYIQPQSAIGGVNANCLYLNSNMCGMYLKSNGANPCDNCRIHTRTNSEPDNRQKTGDIEKLKLEMEMNFEKSDPFHSQRSDYRWWKVANPVNLNNILYQCNIRSPLLFNPMVMMAHFKYRHLILGIYLDKAKKREYVVCGVPGMHMVDRKPFGDMCRWVQAEGNKPKYGSFGYWIVYIDSETGKILSLK